MPWYRRWRNVFRLDPLDRELEAELQYHLLETVDRLTARGMPESQAWREARRRLGNYSVHKERTRDMNIARWLDSTRADAVYAFRQLRRSPGFAATAILSLALGIGANTAIFQLVDSIRLKMLPVQKPQELVLIDFEKGSTRSGWWSSRNATMTYAEWDQIRTQQQAFTSVMAWSVERFNLAVGGEPRFAEGLYVSGNFFDTLGVGAVVGRTLQADDDSPNCNAGAVLSYAFWQREFGGDPGVLTRTVSLDGHSLPVIGVTPASFYGVETGSQYDVALPLCADRLLDRDQRGRIPLLQAWWLSAMGRLKPGWTAVRATAHLHAISPAVMRATLPPTYKPQQAKGYLANQLTAIEAGNGTPGLWRQMQQPLWLLLATTGLVLLIACSNLANLLLARAAVRESEIAVRLAIGASRLRLVRQLLVESLLLAMAGALLGAGTAVALSRALLALMSTPRSVIFVDVGLDWRVLAFTATLAVLTCMLFGLLPALRATYLSPASTMRTGSRSVTAGREKFSLRRALVATQIALSLVLVFGALLFVRSLQNLMTTNTGFQAQGIMSVNIDFSRAQYPAERRPAIHRDLLERISRLPGVVSASEIDFTPISGSTWDNLAAPDGESAAVDGKPAFYNQAGPGYFHTMGTPLLAGREFTERDNLTAPKVAIVNEMFARKFFGGANPVGHTFHQAAEAGKPEPVFLIVGLVANTKYAELREDFRPIAFFCMAQSQTPSTTPTFVLRIAGSPGQFMKGATAAVAAMNSSIGIEFRPLSAQIEESLSRDKLMAVLSGGFGMLAGLLATIGLYGVISYMVARRRNELGVRIALGADRAHVIQLVIREAVLLLAIGLPCGLVLAWWAGTAASALLFGLPPHDALSLLVAGALLSTVSLIASYIPARRAAGLNPIATLRSE